MRKIVFGIGLSILMAASGLARAADILEPSMDAGAMPKAISDTSLLVFGGRSIEGHVWQPDSLPFVADYGGQVQVGAALAHTPYDLPLGLVVGGEIGASIRIDNDDFGPSGTSGELWAGPTIRHKGLPIGPILLKPAFTFGLTAVTGSYGLERQREIEEDGDATLLYFMAPEIAVSLKSRPNIDFVYRAQHRSGGKNIFFLPALGNMGDTTNANTFGVRVHF
ncbi:hypothetical protein [Notoacmeibacter sp. MSK16QG-6]|uniref:hypothetical protein n=1 Tax=Notoacmeibacter sp. MSK16QG-6 TaxID=2957982 RepID=UPI00209DE492|nr:hypothetical protein [Notoacmeibacter sp. MSK16QG-6]MCP1198928.1 hypothetical protein [Notoacmeibacter sp. MSK16QG-6]